MGMTAILFMWPGTFEQTFVPLSHGSSIWNLTFIGPVVSEEMFKECGQRRWRTTEVYLSYKLTKWAFGSGELKKNLKLGGEVESGKCQIVSTFWTKKQSFYSSILYSYCTRIFYTAAFANHWRYMQLSEPQAKHMSFVYVCCLLQLSLHSERGASAKRNSKKYRSSSRPICRNIRLSPTHALHTEKGRGLLATLTTKPKDSVRETKKKKKMQIERQLGFSSLQTGHLDLVSL